MNCGAMLLVGTCEKQCMRTVLFTAPLEVLFFPFMHLFFLEECKIENLIELIMTERVEDQHSTAHLIKTRRNMVMFFHNTVCIRNYPLIH